MKAFIILACLFSMKLASAQNSYQSVSGAGYRTTITTDDQGHVTSETVEAPNNQTDNRGSTTGTESPGTVENGETPGGSQQTGSEGSPRENGDGGNSGQGGDPNHAIRAMLRD